MFAGIGAERSKGFSLIEVILGFGLASVLLLTVVLLGTSALSSDAKVSHTQVASAVAESQLDLLGANIAVNGSSARSDFWSASDGAYSGSGTSAITESNGVEYQCEYTLATVNDSGGQPLGGAGNRLRQVNLKLSWWEGEKGRPGYGRSVLHRTRLFRQSHVR